MACEASAGPRGSSRAGMTLQTCSELGPRGCVFRPRTEQPLMQAPPGRACAPPGRVPKRADGGELSADNLHLEAAGRRDPPAPNSIWAMLQSLANTKEGI